MFYSLSYQVGRLANSSASTGHYHARNTFIVFRQYISSFCANPLKERSDKAPPPQDQASLRTRCQFAL